MTVEARIALFIDAENASAKHLSHYLKLTKELGRPTIKRCYGDAASLKKWEKAITEHHLMPMFTPPSANKENASDFALTIDAVSLLHHNLFDHAVIASSDADFTQLAMHIRENGKKVDGIGEAKAATSLQLAFDRFSVIGAPIAKKSAMAKPVPALATASPTPTHKRELHATFDRLSKTGRVTLATFGKAFKQDHPHIDLGKGKLKKTLLSIGMGVNDQQEVTQTP